MKTTIALIAAGPLAPIGELHAAERSKPNIVYILCDDIGCCPSLRNAAQ